MKLTLWGRVVGLMMRATAQAASYRATLAILRSSMRKLAKENGELAARVALAELRARNLQTQVDALRAANDERARAQRSSELAPH